jgi:uncharacterized protein with ParB-like and HNH nuclease domain
VEALQATPQTIQEVFARLYFIPEYQRPYSWEKEHCEKLWEDIHAFVESKPNANDRYFLGNIVLYEDNGNFCVVDGQQRLITLSLLMRAVFEKVQTYDKLERCLFIFDDETGKNTGKIKINSEVIDEEKENLEKILANSKPDGDSLYSKNYILFQNIINDWVRSLGSDKTQLKLFINILLNNVVLLPIRCGDLDDALTIFETINNRGLSLSDTDIFKAKLHKNSRDKHKEFIKRWNELNNGYEDIFRIYMYILRAKDQITEKEIGLRSFFLSSVCPRLDDWQSVMDDLEKIDACIDFFEEACPVDDCSDCDKNKLCKWFQILYYYPNQYWQYPIYIYIYLNLLTEKGKSHMIGWMNILTCYSILFDIATLSR